MKGSKEDLYKTSDLYFSAFLRTAGCTQVKHEKDERGRTYFFFEDAQSIPRLKDDYYNNRAKVIALEFTNNIRSQKSILFSE